jgi:hypothetical protein
MADQVEQQDIRGLDIDKLIKGFALTEFTFKNECNISPTSGDSIRWYQETSADLTPTTPSQVANVGFLSDFPILEATWTRNTSYPRKYAAKGYISMEDIKTADIDVLARSILRITRAVMKQVDTRIEALWTSDAGQTFATTSVGGDQWDAASAAADIVKDLLHAKKLLADNGYNPEGASLIVDPVGMRDIMTWLITGKGSNIPNFASEKIKTGTVMNLLGLNVKVSVNATADQAIVIIPKQACTWKTSFPLSSKVIDDPGVGKEIRIWEEGEAIVTDPNAIVKITDTVS